jgi:hypothetical protein
MARVKVQIHSAGAQEILKSAEVAALMAEAAEQVAEIIREETGIEPDIESYTTDRAVSSVGVPVTVQATEGALTRAAAAVGLEVRPQ